MVSLNGDCLCCYRCKHQQQKVSASKKQLEGEQLRVQQLEMQLRQQSEAATLRERDVSQDAEMLKAAMKREALDLKDKVWRLEAELQRVTDEQRDISKRALRAPRINRCTVMLYIVMVFILILIGIRLEEKMDLEAAHRTQLAGARQEADRCAYKANQLEQEVVLSFLCCPK